MSAEADILYGVENGVAHPATNRPKKMNAITAAMGGEFA